MRDNPLHVRVFGDDPAAREESLTRLFGGALRRIGGRGVVEGAFIDGRLVGVCGRIEPGKCRLTVLERMRFLPSLLEGNPLPVVKRITEWVSAWTKRDPDPPHWHLGPVAVVRGEQGKGVGRALLKSFCDRMDRERASAYLETDREPNVRFYERAGFAVEAREDVVGVPCWFMSRRPAT